MKYTVHYSTRFKKSLKRVKQLPGFQPDILKKTISILAEGGTLPKSCKDHQLTGSLKDFRECHLATDILLIYQIDKGILVLTLVNIGSHSQLFK